MWNFQDTFETCKQSFIIAFSNCMTVPLRQSKPLLCFMGKLNLFIEFKINRLDIYSFDGKWVEEDFFKREPVFTYLGKSSH